MRTSKCGGSLNVERNRYRSAAATAATAAPFAGGRNSQSFGAPAGRNHALPRINGREESSITPGKVDGARGGTIASAVLFREPATGRRILSNDCDEAVGVVLDRSGESGKRGGGGCVGSDGNARRKVREEWLRDGGDADGA